jgi:hypothetical protein
MRKLDVESKLAAEDAFRTLDRSYELEYDAESFLSLLSSVLGQGTFRREIGGFSRSALGRSEARSWFESAGLG